MYRMQDVEGWSILYITQRVGGTGMDVTCSLGRGRITLVTSGRGCLAFDRSAARGIIPVKGAFVW